MCNRNFCDYNSYYNDQLSGAGLGISYYRGLPYQRGYGKFSNLAKRWGIPALKYILKQGWELGKDMYSDIREGKKLGSSFKSNIRKRAANTMKDIGEKIDQSGKGLRKRPRLIKKRSKRRKTTKAIVKRRRRRSTKPKKRPVRKSRKPKKSRRRRKVKQSDIFQ